ncbi:MAG: SusD/RagB family nutrient-binding outer membrane lipoprotein [Bacteroidetes bacterium]|nr:SusD/RagB family nutrient-binding outer membrane lipoprotein [Bacteroidota bacterium]
MKTKLFSLLLISIIFLASCGKWIDSGLNVDPTAPADASLNVILPAVEGSTAYVLGGDINRFTALLTQHILGTDRQHKGLYEYQITESDLNNAWVTMYAGPMMDLKIMIDKSRDNGSPHYQGVAEVMMAYCLGMWTDILGDVPYSEAFQGNKDITPKFEAQSVVYTTLHTLLDSAIIHLGAAASNFKPAGDDFMYNGDLSLWTKAAYTLKARFYLHTKDFAGALGALTNGFAANSDDMRFTFGNSETEANPWYQFIVQRGDIATNEMLITMMNNLNDPRRSAYATPDTDGVYKAGMSLGDLYYTSINSPVEFITFAEGKFIEAECKFYNNDLPGAYAAYLAGITASIQKYDPTADVASYLAQASVGVGEANLTLKNIIEQKYIALFTQYESWSDWRRTGFPVITRPPLAQLSAVPRRFPYPQSENNFNHANLVAVPGYAAGSTFMLTEVWWDTLWQ